MNKLEIASKNFRSEPLFRRIQIANQEVRTRRRNAQIAELLNLLSMAALAASISALGAAHLLERIQP